MVDYDDFNGGSVDGDDLGEGEDYGDFKSSGTKNSDCDSDEGSEHVKIMMILLICTWSYRIQIILNRSI